jgi:hypothetical protein
MIQPAVPSAVSCGDVREGNNPYRAFGQCTHSLSTGIETVRERCICQHHDGDGAGMGGMANRGERSINIVMLNKPKVLEGLSQKGNVAGTRSPSFLVMGTPRYRWTERAQPTRVLLERNMATPYVSRQGKRAVRQARGRAGMGGWKKRRPSCSGMDRG